MKPKKEGHPALAALTRRSHSAGNLTLRPLTLGSYSLACRAGLRLVLGPEYGDQVDANGKPVPLPAKRENQPYELAAFAFIHSAELSKVLDSLDAGEKAFRRAVDEYAIGLSMADLSRLADMVPGMVQDAFSALVVPTKSDPDESGFTEGNEPGRRE